MRNQDGFSLHLPTNPNLGRKNAHAISILCVLRLANRHPCTQGWPTTRRPTAKQATVKSSSRKTWMIEGTCALCLRFELPFESCWWKETRRNYYWIPPGPHNRPGAKSQELRKKDDNYGRNVRKLRAKDKNKTGRKKRDILSSTLYLSLSL